MLSVRCLFSVPKLLLGWCSLAGGFPAWALQRRHSGKLRRFILSAFRAFAYFPFPGFLPVPPAQEMVVVDDFLAILLVTPVAGHLFQLD